MYLFGRQNILKMKLLQQHKTNIFLGFILILAAFLRLFRIGDYLTFLGDEGRDVLVVYNILHGHLTLLGPTASVGGFFLGPIYYYFMTPFLWLFNYNPVGPAVMVALFGILTVWLVYYVGAKFFSVKAGVIAALLYAVAPVVILYSRSSWNPNLMPITTLLLMWVLYKAISKSKFWQFILVGFIFGIAMQLHYIEVFVGAIIILYILITRIYLLFRREYKNYVQFFKRLVKDFIGVGVGFLIGWSPFLAFEFRHGFNNIRAIINFIFHPQTTGNGVGVPSNFFGTVQDVFFRVFGRLVLNIPSPQLYPQYTSWQISIWTWASWIVGLVSVGFLLWQLYKQWKNKEKFLQYLLLAMWILLGVFFFGFYKKNIYDYYFEFLFPVPFLLVGACLAYLFTKNVLVRLLCIIVLVALIVINLQGVPFRYPANRQLLQTETISKFVLDKTNNKPFNFALITGGNSDHAYRYFFTVWGHAPTTIENAQVDPKRSTVTNQLLVVCESLPCYPLGNSLWEIAGFGRAQVVGHWKVSVVEIYKLEHYQPVINK